ncbi:hypothetical protein AVEN_34010-1 [Araneus ventricosus]|uniref:Uncharacterized protein n=1 Tax=Araneus ventricosus TaxID=182803 RepID=A0A4Y2E5P5_ARAVE|nr:hypothetical protein AVEN_34010-1 [Araneus ventricosus]
MNGHVTLLGASGLPWSRASVLLARNESKVSANLVGVGNVMAGGLVTHFLQGCSFSGRLVQSFLNESFLIQKMFAEDTEPWVFKSGCYKSFQFN